MRLGNGWVLGDLGGAKGRSVEAWSGVGGLEKKEGCSADIFREEKKKTGWRDRALMRASLRDAQNSQTLSFPLSFHSGIGRGSGEEEDRTERKENSDFGLWFAGGLSLLSLARSYCQLKVSLY